MGALALAVPTALVGVALTGTTAPAHAAVTDSGGQWLWAGTARTVNNVRDDVGFGLLPKTVQPTGKGVGVALIDTGVAPVPGLTTGNVVNGPDLSFDSQDPAKRYIDGYGHGTHMAGIISARTPDLTGLAPDAKLTSIKVGSSSGAVDVSQVIAAVDWAVAHRNDDPKNPIRVLVLAYGTDGVQKYQLDPLGTAVENAWRAGITVVAAGGNRGNKAKLLNPATNPFVLAVGAYDDSGTVTWNDDKLASFTSVGDTSRRIDLVAPGRSIVSLRAPGSVVDTGYPDARLGTGYFLGSGSSQATAVTGAIVADLLQLFPSLTPDQVKYLTYCTAFGLGNPKDKIYGLDISAAYKAYSNPKTAKGYSVAAGAQKFAKSTGTGTLEGARGTAHVSDNGVALTGENDIFGPFSTKDWAKASANQTAWKGGAWMGHEWTGNGWEKSPAGMSSWTGRYWVGQSWAGRYWVNDSWTGRYWVNDSWS
jgi:serine protease AprX